MVKMNEAHYVLGIVLIILGLAGMVITVGSQNFEALFLFIISTFSLIAGINLVFSG